MVEGRRGGRGGRPAVPSPAGSDVAPPQLVEVREDLVVRHAELLRVARGEAQQVIVAGLKRRTTEGKGSKYVLHFGGNVGRGLTKVAILLFQLLWDERRAAVIAAE